MSIFSFIHKHLTEILIQVRNLWKKDASEGGCSEGPEGPVPSRKVYWEMRDRKEYDEENGTTLFKARVSIDAVPMTVSCGEFEIHLNFDRYAAGV